MQRFGAPTAFWHLLVSVTQFHVMFYASRPLPNIFALAVVMHALAFWMEGKQAAFILSSAFAILVFRAELALLLGIILFMDLAVGRVRLLPTIGYGLLATIISLGATVGVDSVMWRQFWLWPEGQVLYYNVVLNKSSNWGTSPWAWYFYSALPRCMCSSLLFVPLGVHLDKRTLIYVFPALAFVFLYSFLPHKELRFIVYVFPLLNIPVAEACKRLVDNALRKKSIWKQLFALIAVGHLAVNLVFSMALLFVSKHNYPGGQAIMKVQEMEAGNTQNHPAINLHIDVYTAQTGVSRFTQLYDDGSWQYNKSEDLAVSELATFTHLLVGNVEDNDEVISGLASTHDKIGRVEAFQGIEKLSFKAFPPFRLKFSTAVNIFRMKELNPT